MIREATEQDIPEVMEVIEDARAGLKAQGIPQWQDAYPDEKTIRQDIHDHASWLMELDGRIIGTCCIRFERDPNYSYIENGSWLNDEEYGVIHRIAVLRAERGHGYAGEFFTHAERLAGQKNIGNLRADTHEVNQAMQKALTRQGFVLCGKVYMWDGAPRIAFQKILD